MDEGHMMGEMEGREGVRGVVDSVREMEISS